MSREDKNIGTLLESLNKKNFINYESIEKIEEYLGNKEKADKDPVYVKIFSATGAWFAAVFLIIALFMSGLLNDTASSIGCGVIFLGTAIFFSRINKSYFLHQMALALSIAGQFIFVTGLVMDIDEKIFEGVIIVNAFTTCIMYPLLRNRIYRFLAPLGLTILIAIWIVYSTNYYYIHILVLSEAFMTGLLVLKGRLPKIFKPLKYSAVIMLPSTIIIINLSQLSLFDIYFPTSLLISNAGIAAGMIFTYLYLGGGLKSIKQPWMIIASVSTILLAMFTGTGILAALSLMILGYAYDDRVISFLSYVFLPVFLVFFYYNLHVDLAQKSFIIGGSGLILIVIRMIIKFYYPVEELKS